MRSIAATALLVGCAAGPPVVSLAPTDRVAPPAKPVVVPSGPVVPDAFFDEPAEGPYASIAAYCGEVLARQGNDAPRFCDPDPELAQHARISGAQFVAHDARGDFVFCSLALETARGWYVLSGFECSNTMNEIPYDFRVTELSRDAFANVVVRVSVTVADTKYEYESRCGLGASRVPRCVSLATAEDGYTTGVHFDGEVVVLGKETIDEGGGELRSPDGLLPETPPGRYRIVFP